MPVNLKDVIHDIDIENTVLILGAGASVPSHAPSANTLIEAISKEFKIDASGLNLREISGLAENKRNRNELINCIRSNFKNSNHLAQF